MVRKNFFLVALKIHQKSTIVFLKNSFTIREWRSSEIWGSLKIHVRKSQFFIPSRKIQVKNYFRKHWTFFEITRLKFSEIPLKPESEGLQKSTYEGLLKSTSEAFTLFLIQAIEINIWSPLKFLFRTIKKTSKNSRTLTLLEPLKIT